MALGASRNQVTGMVVGQALKLATFGVVIGLAGAFAVTRLLAVMLYGVSPQDGWVFTLVPLCLTAVAAAASYLPARRAARVDPLIALRYE
jgi:ABC-type antimicrobial peptide transport system permease subunit